MVEIFGISNMFQSHATLMNLLSMYIPNGAAIKPIITAVMVLFIVDNIVVISANRTMPVTTGTPYCVNLVIFYTNTILNINLVDYFRILNARINLLSARNEITCATY